MNDIVRLTREGELALVTIDHPPVNTLAQPVRAGLARAFAQIAQDSEVRAVVLLGAGKSFVSGGDMREFEIGVAAPGYHEVLDAIECCAVPVIAAMHGTVMGAGVELASACHFRLAQAQARFGLPEISLGIIPGGSGTQRVPRLIGFAAALDIMLSGRSFDAAEAQRLGLVDALAEGDLLAQAKARARELVRQSWTPRRTGELAVADAALAPGLLAAKRAEVARTMRNRNAPLVLLDALQSAIDLPFEQGLRKERELSDLVERAPEGRAFRHLFFAERELRRLPGLDANTPARTVQDVGIIGAGTMGGGIAMAFANAGLSVRLVETDQARLQSGLANIEKNYDRSVARGSLSAEEKALRLKRISGALDFQSLAAADLIIEAVFENLALKKDIFRRLDLVAKPGAILATNTSTLDIDALAACTSRPQDVLGLHFFSPAQVMRLLEIVQTRHNSPDVLATALDLAKRIKKTGVVAKNAYGFIGNRMMDPYGREAERLLLEGATPEEVDGALEDFGMAMGVLAVFDLAGVDIGHLVRAERKALLPQDPSYYRASAMLVERGWLGQKASRGYYRYDNPERRRTPDPEVVALLRAEGERLGIPQRRIGREEIVRRCLLALINEGAKVLEEGVAHRASDIDIVYTAGYGFPRYRGGPMFYADTLGLPAVLAGVEDLATRLDAQYWQPAPLLQSLAQACSSFAAWQKARGD
ncbi:3-hydroxyacyl-CoA dehydrogenase [Burkholderiales bacterium]|nr:3-hydroxyacyl-CoA dehydrogenase [Burkholderiales bacterium]